MARRGIFCKFEPEIKVNTRMA